GELMINEDVIDKDNENVEEQESKQATETSIMQEKELNDKEEEPLATRRMDSATKIEAQKQKQRRLLSDATTAVVRVPAVSKKCSIASPPQVKVEMSEEDIIRKRRKNNRCCSKDGNSKMQEQPRKKRQLSTNSDTIRNNRKSNRKVSTMPVHKQQHHSTLNGDVLSRGGKEKQTKMNNSNHHNMKHQKINNNVIAMNTNDTLESYHDSNTSSIYYQCDHFGNQINADIIPPNEQQEHEEHLSTVTGFNLGSNNDFGCSSSTRMLNNPTIINNKQISPNHAVPQFYPKRPLHDFVLPTTSSHLNHANTHKRSQSANSSFVPQSLEEFLEHEWEMSSDFILQQTIPYDVSSLLSCLYQFRTENASLNQKVDELKHRRDLLRLRHSNLKRHLVEIFNPPQVQEAKDRVPVVSTVEPIISPKHPKLEFGLPQEQEKRLNADYVLQQQILQQTVVSTVSSTLPRPTPQNNSSSTTEGSRHTQNSLTPTSYIIMKKSSSKQARQANSILENQLRQNILLNNKKSTKLHTSDQQQKANAAAAASLLQLNKIATITNNHPSAAHSSSNSIIVPPTTDNTLLASSRERRISSSSLPGTSSTHPHHATHHSTNVNCNHSSSSSSSPYEQDIYLSKNSPQTNGTNLEYLQAMLAAGGGSGGIPPNFLLAPTWNIHNFGFANFSNSSMIDDTVLRNFCPNSNLNSLENVQQQQPLHHQKQ
ncbi:unnamed protein product, partial [Didymodactylos carnosus]